MRPLHLLAHIKCLSDFTEEEVTTLKYSNLRMTTLERVLRFTIRVYDKFFKSSYTNDI
jgi:hypothetical protein